MTKNGSAVAEIVKMVNAAIAPPSVMASDRSWARNAKPSRARTVSPAGRPWRRARSAKAATATARNESASTTSATRRSPAAPNAPPSSGPPVNPSERSVSIRPLARATSPSPAAAGTRENSAGCTTLAPAPISATSGRTSQSVSTQATSASATAACASETPISSARFSKRSTIAPAAPAPSTSGPHMARNTAETANVEPVRSCTCRISGIIARKSPSADSPAEAARRRRSRDMGRSSSATARAPLGLRERAVIEDSGTVLSVRLAGGLRLEADGVELPPPASRRARGVLAYLALHPGPQPRGRLAATFWPDVLDESARTSLRAALTELRRALGPAADALVATRDAVALEADVDARAFAAAPDAATALAACRAPILDGFDEEWALEARQAHL